MPSRRIERGVDDALLATATWAGYLYVRRRMRRLFSHVAVGAVLAAGLGLVVTVAVALVWKRSRTTLPNN
ncbi:MAG TPA: hypothetical protein VKG38_03520 [Solirubrobacteraceae bacterium]|nr:hypothetical protein [Solirubrobacteraceae bacterium]